MLRKTLIVSASLVLFGLTAMPALARVETMTPGGAKGSAVNTEKIACVGTAVGIREKAIDDAMTTLGTAMNGAYSARATALSAAYSQTTGKEVATAVKTAWTTFQTSERAARKAWRTSRDAAWTAYRTAAVACKAPAGTGDGVNAGADNSIN